MLCWVGCSATSAVELIPDEIYGNPIFKMFRAVDFVFHTTVITTVCRILLVILNAEGRAMIYFLFHAINSELHSLLGKKKHINVCNCCRDRLFKRICNCKEKSVIASFGKILYFIYLVAYLSSYHEKALFELA